MERICLTLALISTWIIYKVRLKGFCHLRVRSFSPLCSPVKMVCS
jgi:hypothetical protein